MRPDRLPCLKHDIRNGILRGPRPNRFLTVFVKDFQLIADILKEV